MPSNQPDFLTEYLAYTANTEIPAFFNRWSAIAGIGAMLGRQYFLPHSHKIIYPNMYVMLIGTSGTRKSTAIKLMKKFMIGAGYINIAASKTTKEKFLLDLSGETDDPNSRYKSTEDFLDQHLSGSGADVRECFIMADEFNDFFGNGNIEFISLLGNLWDYEGIFTNRIKNGKSVTISNPTISILGGNTPTGFSLAFPTDVLGQGFFSRILLIYGEPNGRRIAFPETPSGERTVEIGVFLGEIKVRVFGESSLSSTAKNLLGKIYHSAAGVDDVRFDSYSTRRLEHLLKLCLVVSASRLSKSIEEYDVVYANTILSHTEQLMPKALGEFGRAKNADVSHRVLEIIAKSLVPVTNKMLWREVRTDLEKIEQLAAITGNLMAADKIQFVPSHKGFLPKYKPRIERELDDTVDWSLLTDEEKGIRK